jgi:hypothetical protein
MLAYWLLHETAGQESSITAGPFPQPYTVAQAAVHLLPASAYTAWRRHLFKINFQIREFGRPDIVETWRASADLSIFPVRRRAAWAFSG